MPPIKMIAGNARDVQGAEALIELGVNHIVTSTRAATPAALPAALETYRRRAIDGLA